MLSPHQKMSRFQTAQMFSLQDDNIYNIAIRGVFDDCQDIVKAVSNDHAFKQAYQIGAVNSINWGGLQRRSFITSWVIWLRPRVMTKG
ncbi:MAG: hypothetical protein R3E95_12500 [Thiolinea sp.]